MKISKCKHERINWWINDEGEKQHVFGEESVLEGEASIGKFMLWIKSFSWSYSLSLSLGCCKCKVQPQLKNN